jgi:MFS family permease
MRAPERREDAGPRGLRAVPRGVWALGFVSLFMDVSSEMIHALLPVFLVTSLGASAVSVGLIEGVAESTASIAKLFSGALSDWLGRRKPLVLLGYGLAALTKPLFPLANSVGTVLLARFVDRIGKGIRGAPRDALIADLTPEGARGASYGLRQALDTGGAVAGPLLATLLMLLLAGDLRAVFWVAVAPAFVSLALVAIGVEDRRAPDAPARARAPLRREDLRRLGAGYWFVLAAAVVASLARFSEAFLVLRGQSLGLAAAFAPLPLVAMNLAYAAVSYPVGALSDRIGRGALLAAGFAVLAASDAVLALASGHAGLFAGVLLWGLHLGLTQGMLAAMVADAAPEPVRGTAFGLFHLVSGLALLLASAAAGFLWESFGPRGTFLAGAALAGLAFVTLVLARRRAEAMAGR